MQCKNFNHKFFNQKVNFKAKMWNTSKQSIAKQLGLSMPRFWLIKLGLIKPSMLEVKTMALYFQRDENDFLL